MSQWQGCGVGGLKAGACLPSSYHAGHSSFLLSFIICLIIVVTADTTAKYLNTAQSLGSNIL